MKQLSSLLLVVLIGCARPATAPTNEVAHRDVPAESFSACDGKPTGASCVVHVDDVEALGACAPAPKFSSDRRLYCNGQGG